MFFTAGVHTSPAGAEYRQVCCAHWKVLARCRHQAGVGLISALYGYDHTRLALIMFRSSVFFAFMGLLNLSKFCGQPPLWAGFRRLIREKHWQRNHQGNRQGGRQDGFVSLGQRLDYQDGVVRYELVAIFRFVFFWALLLLNCFNSTCES